MKILVSNDFKHGRAALKKGQRCVVPDRIGGYFLGVGWAKELSDDAENCEVIDPALFGTDAPPTRTGNTLEVQDVHITSEAKIGGQ